MYNQLTTQRIRSIDTFRGITILVMIFVNDVAGVAGIPTWLKHMPADADAMTFVDIVFPAFLFIAGMSLPFAINNRLAKGDSFWQLQAHIVWRTLGLLVLGIFMVNAESGYNEKSMKISINWWSLLFYGCAILVWNVYRFQNKLFSWLFRGVGIVGLVILAFMYKAGEDGSQGMTPRWWGILGLIGWAYLFCCLVYQLVKGRIGLLLISIAACIAWYTISKADAAKSNLVLEWMAARAGHAAHTGIVLCGIVVSLLFFDAAILRKIYERFIAVCVFALMAALAGYWIRPYYAISKIYATPTWCLYSVAICALLFSFLYWFIDIVKYQGWTKFFQPAASNSLLVYILPAIIMHLQIAAGLYFMPAEFRQGILGIAWSAGYALLIMLLAMGLNKLKIRLQL